VVAGSEPKLKRFPTIVRMWARPPEEPAAKAVWLASPATDGKTGLLVSMMSPSVMVGGALREGLRALLRRPAAPLDIHIDTVPYYKG
jgi:glucose 1-dehydrogenase